MEELFLPLDPDLEYKADLITSSGGSPINQQKIVSASNRYLYKAGMKVGADLSHDTANSTWKQGLAGLVFWFVTIAVVAWLFLYSLARPWINNPDGSVDTGKVLWVSTLIALVVVVLAWMIRVIWYK